MFKIHSTFDARFVKVGTLIVKVTHRCNLDCLYCYENVTKTGEDMRLETFFQLADLVLTYSQKPVITFLFHGGEPTLLSNEWYAQAIEYAQTQAQRHNKRVQFSMQTNLLGINANKIEFFKRYDIKLGISLDGPASLQSTMRGGEDRVFAHFKQIQRAGVKAGILITINGSNYEHFERICNWLIDEAEVSHFKANSVTPVGRGYHLPPLSPAQIFQAQHDILEFLIANKGQWLMERNLSLEIERFFATPEQRAQLPQTLCHEQRCGAGTDVLGVTPTGDILPCGRFTWDESEQYIGHLDDVATMESNAIFSKKVDKFHAQVPQSWYHCDTCEAKRVCGFGCQAFIIRSKAQANVDCLPTQMRYQYYLANRERLRPVYEAILQQRKHTPAPTTFSIKQKDGSFKTYTLPPS